MIHRIVGNETVIFQAGNGQREISSGFCRQGSEIKVCMRAPWDAPSGISQLGGESEPYVIRFRARTGYLPWLSSWCMETVQI